MVLVNPYPSKSLAQLVVMLVPIAVRVLLEHGVVWVHKPVNQVSRDGTIEAEEERVARGTRPAMFRQSASPERAREVTKDVQLEESADTVDALIMIPAAARANMVASEQE